MKKLTITIALTALLTLSAFANPVDVKTAQKVATTFLNNNGAKSAQLTDLSKAAGFPNLYIFSTESSFVIISRDDCAKPILGYSLSDKFSVEDMPENLRWWLQGYSDEIQWGIDHQTKATSEAAKQWTELAAGKPNIMKVASVVDALIETEWGQNSPYNNLCPSNSKTGCVATAMAQIMKYYQHPSYGIGSHSYIHNTYGELSVNFREFQYDWIHMTKTYNNTSTEDEKQAVATLMYHCGVSVDMDYSPNTSGALTIDAAEALILYFNYSSEIQVLSRSEYSDAEWISMLKADLDQNHPIQYSGNGPSGGHSFICDGYDNDDNFHFNWGWNGQYSNSFFPIDGLTPGSHNYNSDQKAVFGIKPANCSIDAPTNFTATLITGTKNVSLSWETVSNAVGYKIFRNGDLIETSSSGETTSYLDERIPYGTNVYHIRSVDSEGEMSLPSEYRTVFTAFPAPTGFTASLSSTATVNLSWNTSESAIAYNVYCNDVLTATNVTTTYYENIHPIPGASSYYVRGVDVLGDESDASNSASVSVPFNTPVVSDLNASISSQNALLSWSNPEWCYPQSSDAVLSYGSGKEYLIANFLYYGHRHLADDLAQYSNKSLYKVSTYIKTPGTYTLLIYTNTIDDMPDVDALADTRVLKCTQGGIWMDIPLSQPIIVNGNTDLWIVFKQENTNSTAPLSTFKLSQFNPNACYCGPSISNITPYLSNYNFSWFINAYLTDGTYTYNLYDNGSPIASNISDTTYMVSNIADNTIHQYTVKTNYYGGASTSSNKAGLALGNYAIAELDMDNNDKMTIAEGSTLTVTETLSNDNPENLILENGAQLIHNSEGVKATVKKDIAAWTPETPVGGWYFIASPINSTELAPDNVDNMLTDGNETEGLRTYDLYRLENDNWKNYRNNAFNLANGKGYLYANEGPQTLSFKGEIKPYDAENNTVTISSGWNLIGNPFTCNVVPDMAYHTLNNGTSTTSVNANEGLVAPGMGIAVYSENDGTLSFNLPTEGASASSNGNLQMTLTQQVTNRNSTNSVTIDNAIVNFNESEGLPKFNLLEANSKLYIPNGNKEYAIVGTEAKGEMPLNFKPNQNGTFTLTVQPESVEMSYLLLIDNMTGTHINLLTTPSYTFEAKTDDYESRFKLLFAAANEETAEDESFGFIINGQFQSIIGQGLLQVIDLNGRILRSADEVDCIGLNGLSAGVYVLRFIAANNVKTQKIVIE